jgi:hypothetical protein
MLQRPDQSNVTRFHRLWLEQNVQTLKIRELNGSLFRRPVFPGEGNSSFAFSPIQQCCSASSAVMMSEFQSQPLKPD